MCWPHIAPVLPPFHGRLPLMRRKVGFCNQTFCSPHTDWIASGKVFGPPADWERVCWWGKAWHKLWSAGLAAPTIAHGEARGGRGEERRPPGAGWRPSRWQYGAGAFATQHTLASEGCPQREEWSADSPTQLTGEARAAGVPPGTNAMEVEWVGGWSELRRGPASCLALCGSGAQRQPRRARGDKGS